MHAITIDEKIAHKYEGQLGGIFWEVWKEEKKGKYVITKFQSNKYRERIQRY